MISGSSTCYNFFKPTNGTTGFLAYATLINQIFLSEALMSRCIIRVVCKIINIIIRKTHFSEAEFKLKGIDQ
jgi:hypothetical protein